MKNSCTGIVSLKKSRSNKFTQFAVFALGICLFFPAAHLFAAPQGGAIVQGQGSISQLSAAQTTINQNSQSLAINWNSFNLGTSERVTFNQPNASSIALNRITSGSPSQILGQINANGRVILSNPSGILFGANAQVNVGGLLATGLDIDPAEFMTGNFSLTSNNGVGYVINKGLLSAATGGAINLLGGVVKNDGVIIADFGQINLLAGESAVVDFTGDGLLNFQLTEATKQNLTLADSAAENNGTLQANGGKIVIEASVAQDIFTQAVNNTGIIRANKVEDIGGIVRLSGNGGAVRNSGNIIATANSSLAGGDVSLVSTNETEMTGAGSIDVSNADGIGGFFRMLGQKIGLFDTVSVNATGSQGGGEVKIGGDVQGGGTLQKSDATVMSRLASIDASATENGDGGIVVLWAEKIAKIYGQIKARGGESSGNGGFIETSGKEFLEVSSVPDAGATAGEAGEWLLDPTSINIIIRESGNTQDGIGLYSGDPTGTYSSSSGPASLYVDTITTALAAGTSVTVVTTDAGTETGTGAGDITLVTSIEANALSSNVSLTLDAYNDIIFLNGSTISATDAALDVILYAKNVDLTNAGKNTGATPVNAIETNGGSFLITAVGTSMTDNKVLTSGGNVDVNGPLTVNGDVEFNTGLGLGDITLAAVTANPNAATDNLTLTASGDVTVGAIGSVGAEFGDVVINASNASLVGDVVANSVTANQTALLSINAALQLSNGFSQTDVALATTTLSENITTAANDIVFFGALALEGDVNLTSNSGKITFEKTVDSVLANDATLTLVAEGDIDFMQAVGSMGRLKGLTASSTNDVTFFASSAFDTNGINITASATDIGGALSTFNGGDVILNNSAGLTIAASSPITASGDFLQLGAGRTALKSDVISQSGRIAFVNGIDLTGDRLLRSSGSGIELAADVVGNDIFKLETDGDLRVNDISVGTLKLNNISSHRIDAYLAGDFALNSTLDFNDVKNIVLTSDALMTVSDPSASIRFVNDNVISGANSLELVANKIDLGQVGSGVDSSGNPTADPIGLIINTTALNLLSDVTVNGEIDFSNATLKAFVLPIEATGVNASVKLGVVSEKNNSLTLINSGVTRLYGDIAAQNVDFSRVNGEVILVNDITIDVDDVNRPRDGYIDFSNATLSGADKKLTLIAGTGQLYLNDIGSANAPIQLLDIQSASTAELFGDFYVKDSLNFSMLPAVVLNAASNGVVLNSSEGNVNLSNTSVSGAVDFTVSANQGDVLFGAISNVAMLSVSTAGALNLNGDIAATVVGLQGVTGNIILNQSVKIDTSTAGGDIAMQNAKVIGGANTLSLNAGTGDISLGLVGSRTSALSQLNITKAANVALYDDVFVTGGLDFSLVNNVSLLNDIELNTLAGNKNIIFGATDINGASASAKRLLINTGAGLIQLASVGNDTALSDLTLNSSSEVNLGGLYNLAGQFVVENAPALTLASDVTINTADGNVDFSASNINGANQLIIDAGAGRVDFGSVGQTNLLVSLNVKSASRINTGFISTIGGQSYSGDVYLAGDLLVSGADTIWVNGDITLKTNATIKAQKGISIIGAFDGDFALALESTNGDITVLADAGKTQTLNAFSATGKNITVQSVFSQNDISISANEAVLQGGELNSIAGNISVSSATSEITMKDGAVTTASTANKVIYTAVTNLQINNITAGDITLTATGGALQAGVISGGAVTLAAGAGGLHVGAVTGGNVSLQANSDDLTVGTISGNIISLTAKTGAIQVGDIVAAEVTMTANKGDVAVSNITGGDVTLMANLGDLQLGTIKGDAITLTASAGAIQANEVTGSSIKMTAGVGDLKADSISGGGDVTLVANAGDLQLGVVKGSVVTLTAKTGAVQVGEITGNKTVTVATSKGGLNAGTITGGDVNLTAKSDDLQIGNINGDNVVLISDLGTVQVDEINALDVSLTAGQGDLQIGKVTATKLTLDAKTGAIIGRPVDGSSIVAEAVTLKAAKGISAINDAGEVVSLKLIATTLDVDSTANDVLLATQSTIVAPTRPELNLLTVNKLEVNGGDLKLKNVGALAFNAPVNVAGRIDLVSTSQVTINDDIKALEGIAISIGEGTLQTGQDGLILRGNMTTTRGGIVLGVNDLVQLFGNVEALKGDVTVTSDANSISLSLINAGSNKVRVESAGSINALVLGSANIEATQVELISSNTGIGSFAKPLQINASSTFIFGGAAFITGNFGAVSSGSNYVDPGVAVSSANKGQSVSAQEFSFVDTTVFSRELSLFDVVDEGLLLPEDQLEDN